MDRPSSVGIVLLLVLIAGAGLRFVVVNPIRNYQLDFRAYYAAGRALHMGINPYDSPAVRAHVELPGEQSIMPYLYPPPSLLIAYGFSFLPYPAAQVPWALLQYGLGIGALLLLWRATGCAFGSPTSVLLAFAFLLSSSVAELFHWGQFDLIVLALLAGAVLALVRNRPVGAGILLGLGVVAKVTPAVYLAVLLLRKDVKAFAAGIVTVIVSTAAAYLVLSAAVFERWLAYLARFSGGVTLDNLSLRGYLYGAFVEFTNLHGTSTPWIPLGAGFATAATWVAIGLMAAVTLLWMLRHRAALTTAECIAAAVPLTLLSTPMTCMHHGVQLLVPLVMIVTVAARQRRLSHLDLLWISATILMLTVWPVQRFDLGIPDWLFHLAAPTLTYGMVLTWLFMVVRYVPLKLAQSAKERPQTAPAAARPTVDLATGCS